MEGGEKDKKVNKQKTHQDDSKKTTNKAFLSSGIPDFELDGLVVDRHLVHHERRTVGEERKQREKRVKKNANAQVWKRGVKRCKPDGGEFLLRELVLDQTENQTSLSGAHLSEQNNLAAVLAATRLVTATAATADRLLLWRLVETASHSEPDADTSKTVWHALSVSGSLNTAALGCSGFRMCEGGRKRRKGGKKRGTGVKKNTHTQKSVQSLVIALGCGF